MTTLNAGRKAAQRLILAIQCIRCGGQKTLQRHHKDKNPLNNDVMNLEVLCQSCHKAEHMKDGTWGREIVEVAICKVCGQGFQPLRSRRASICSSLCLSEWGQVSALLRWSTRPELQSEPSLEQTDLKPLVTDKFPSAQRQHGECLIEPLIASARIKL